MAVEIVTFVVKGSAQLTVPPDRQEKIQVGSRGVALCRDARIYQKINMKIVIINNYV